MANHNHMPKKLNEEAVKDIRLNYVPRKAGFTVPDFAKKYAVSTTTITQVVKNETWTHVVVSKPAPQPPPAVA